MERIRSLGRNARVGVTLLATGRKTGTGLVMPWLLVLRLYVLFLPGCVANFGRTRARGLYP